MMEPSTSVSSQGVSSSSCLSRTCQFAGRVPLGETHPLCLLKQGQFHSRLSSSPSCSSSSSASSSSSFPSPVGKEDESRDSALSPSSSPSSPKDTASSSSREVLACGLACSEIVSGKILAAVLRSGFDYEKMVLDALEKEDPAPPLAIHTSAGVPACLGRFIEAMEPHLPWSFDGDEQDSNDWFMSLQVEGASAVLASIDLMIQLRQLRYEERGLGKDMSFSNWKVGVGSVSYHGPPSSSPGANTPLFVQKHNQVKYPVPTISKSSEMDFEREQQLFVAEFAEWLAQHGECLGCILFEPQWGSTAAARPWHPPTLREIMNLCHEKQIPVIADEIMCGLGRHAQVRPGDDTPPLFLSKAWELPVDAVTFGKAICAGAFPMSGVLCRQGKKLLGGRGRSVLQSHTYSGGHVRSLMTAISVIEVLPKLLPNVVQRGAELQDAMRKVALRSEGLFEVQGQGLMWGALINRSHPLCVSVSKVLHAFKKACSGHNVLPYFVPVGGFMVTPLFDVESSVIWEIGHRLSRATVQLMADLKGEAEAPVD